MTSLADFHRTVQATIASKRVGAAVFVRYMYHASITGDAIAARLAKTAAAVRDWTAQPLDRIFAQGAEKSRHITLMLEFRGGATALVTWVGTAGRGSGIDLTVVGNHGAIYHDTGAAAQWDEAYSSDDAAPERDLVAWIERAARSGRPEGATP